MTFLIFTSRLVLTPGASRALSSISGYIMAEANVKLWKALESFSSTSSRSLRASRMIAMNCCIKPSCLSRRSLWPRSAVLTCFFRLISSIRVGLTFRRAIGGNDQITKSKFQINSKFQFLKFKTRTNNF